MDGEASRGNRKDKERGGKKKGRGGEEVVVVVRRECLMSHLRHIQKVGGWQEEGMLAWVL